MTIITTLPTPPSRSDPINFADRADEFLGALPTFGDQTNSVASEVNGYSSAASAAKMQAEAAAAAALATANASLWVSGTTYASGVVTYSPITFLSYRRKTVGSGTTDPSDDSTNWQLVAGSGDVSVDGIQTLTNKTIAGTKEIKVAMSSNDFDLNIANYFTKTISGVTTFTVSNVPITGIVAAFVLDITNAGSAAITWFSGVKWAGGSAPVLTVSGRDILGFFTHDAGVTWNGLHLAKDIK